MITLFEVQTPEWLRMDIDTLLEDVENTEFTIDNVSRIRELESKIEMGLDLLVIASRSNATNNIDKLMYEAYVQCRRNDLVHMRNKLRSVSGICVKQF